MGVQVDAVIPRNDFPQSSIGLTNDRWRICFRWNNGEALAHAIVNGTRHIPADTDLRMCKFFRLSEGYFLRLQNAYDIMGAKRRISTQVAKIKAHKSDPARKHAA